jgi:prevent-host-death family protein
MDRDYSIREAKNRLPGLVRQAEERGVVRLTRRGKPVARIVSEREYAQLKGRRKRDLWKAIQEFRSRTDLEALGFTDADFAGLRDRSPGRSHRW